MAGLERRAGVLDVMAARKSGQVLNVSIGCEKED